MSPRSSSSLIREETPPPAIGEQTNIQVSYSLQTRTILNILFSVYRHSYIYGFRNSISESNITKNNYSLNRRIKFRLTRIIGLSLSTRTIYEILKRHGLNILKCKDKMRTYRRFAKKQPSIQCPTLSITIFYTCLCNLT
jgi:hypothetical protein